MPEVHVVLRWPDGAEQRLYSPSLVITERLTVGPATVAEVAREAHEALAIGSQRVEEKYGFPCSRAAASQAALATKASGFPADATVEVVAFEG